MSGAEIECACVGVCDGPLGGGDAEDNAIGIDHYYYYSLVTLVILLLLMMSNATHLLLRRIDFIVLYLYT